MFFNDGMHSAPGVRTFPRINGIDGAPGLNMMGS